MFDPKLKEALGRVQKPGRYTGGEPGSVYKDKNNVDVRFAFCFPDTYEIGMSNIGMRILYGLMNEMPGVWCERVFAPWGDMEEQMRAHAIPLYALESHDPVKAFDLIAFTIGYEMSYTNILNMLELSCVPLLAREREGLENIVFAGGVCRWQTSSTFFRSARARRSQRKSSTATGRRKRMAVRSRNFSCA